MPKVSVICVTNRKGWFSILKDDMDRQTFRDFEVIVADDSREDVDVPKGWTVFQPRKKGENDVWNLNKAYNDCLVKAKGELLVFLQDYIWIPANGLQRFWDDYEQFPNSLITGVGHKALHGLEGISETDMRMFGDKDMEPANFSFWELNWASCPKILMSYFNEDMDRFYGGENQYVARRAELYGCKVMIDRKNVCIGYNQSECGGRPANWERMHVNKAGRMGMFMDLLK